MKYEVTWWGGDSDRVSVSISGAPVTLTTGLPDGETISFQMSAAESESLGLALSKGVGPGLVDELADLRSKLGVLTDDRANLERERDAAWKSAHAQSDEGGKARGIVANTAHVLGVDIDEGDGHRWDLEHMARIVEGARKLRDELEDLRLTTAEDERHMDRQAAEIEHLGERLTSAREIQEAYRTTALEAQGQRDEALAARDELKRRLQSAEFFLAHERSTVQALREMRGFTFPFVPASASKMTVTFAGKSTGADEDHWSTDDTDTLRATIVRQANEITALKEERA